MDKEILIIITVIGFIITLVTASWKVFSKFTEIKDLIQKVKDSISTSITTNTDEERSRQKLVYKNLENKIMTLDKVVDDCIDKVSALNGNIFEKDGIYQELNTLKVLVHEMRKDED